MHSERLEMNRRAVAGAVCASVESERNADARSSRFSTLPAIFGQVAWRSDSVIFNNASCGRVTRIHRVKSENQIT
jgi:hypothetical protein